MTLTAIVTTERNATQRQRATIPKLIVDTIGLSVFASVGSIWPHLSMESHLIQCFTLLQEKYRRKMTAFI